MPGHSTYFSLNNDTVSETAVERMGTILYCLSLTIRNTGDFGYQWVLANGHY